VPHILPRSRGKVSKTQPAAPPASAAWEHLVRRLHHGAAQRRPRCGVRGVGVRVAVSLALYFYFIISLQFQINPVPEDPSDFINTFQLIMPIFRVRGSAATQSPRYPDGAKSLPLPEKLIVEAALFLLFLPSVPGRTFLAEFTSRSVASLRAAAARAYFEAGACSTPIRSRRRREKDRAGRGAATSHCGERHACRRDDATPLSAASRR
jgi:hypothetical protein